MNLRRFLIVAGLLVFFLFPALISYKPVGRTEGLVWAASIGAMVASLLLAHWRRRLLAAGVFAAAMVLVALNVLLSVSYSLQDFAFNEAFFSHLNLPTLRSGFVVEPAGAIGGTVYLLAAPILAAVAIAMPPPIRRWSAASSVAAILIAALLSFPLWSLLDYRHARSTASERLQSEIGSIKSRTATNVSGEGDRLNLVMIYLEGIELNYFDEDRFPGLTPNLSELFEAGMVFTGIEQFPGTEWTIAGMVASQCGLPLLSESYGNEVLGSDRDPFDKVTCLAEYLKQRDYSTTYVGGARLAFANKGDFLLRNGFDRALGFDELPSTNAQYWGLYDSTLFMNVTSVFDALSEVDGPFLLQLLTLDTHPVGHPSPECPDYRDGSDRMLNAVHCSDILVADFVRHVRQSAVAERTVVALVSDHLMQRAPHLDRLKDAPRRLTFVLFGPDLEATRRTGPGTHFDIGPTILEAVGAGQVEMPFGSSLLSGDQGRVQVLGLEKSDLRAFDLSVITDP